MKPPVVVIPGITASSLKDFYPGDAEMVWGVVGKEYERVALHPDDLEFEQIEPALLRPNEAFGIPYEQLVNELRHDLSPSWEEPRPVYAFAHDWRQPLHRVVDQLAAFIDEVVRRTALMRHYARGGYTAASGRVDVVGHSMGGLIVSGYLARHETDHRVRKVVTLGTPFGGSFEAVIKVITGTSGLTGGVPKSREREVARLTPGLYHLLPDRELTIERGAGNLPRSLFDAGLWQHGVLETIATHIERIGLAPASTKSGRMEQATKLLQRMLDEARTFRKEVSDLSLNAVGLGEDDWLAVVGLGEETRVHLKIDDKGKRQGPWFDLTSLHRKNGYPMPQIEGGTVTAGLTDTGDGTVPYWAAVPSFLDPGKLVCVSSDDFGYWELADRLIGWKTNLHSMLPAMNRVIKLSAAFLQSDEGRKARGHPGIRGRRAPGCLASGQSWDPPFVGLEEEIPQGIGGSG